MGCMKRGRGSVIFDFLHAGVRMFSGKTQTTKVENELNQPVVLSHDCLSICLYQDTYLHARSSAIPGKSGRCTGTSSSGTSPRFGT